MTRLIFRPVTRDDFPLLVKWRQRPHVLKWWGEKSEEDLLKEFEREMADPLVERSIVSQEGRDIAFLQECDAYAIGDGWWPDAEPGTVAIDFLIGEPDSIGKGLGTVIITHYTEAILARTGVHTVIADPEPGNAASIRACEKAGYRNTGEVETPGGVSVLMVRTQ